MKYVLIPESVYNALCYGADQYSTDLDTGLEDGLYEEGHDELEKINNALVYEPIAIDNKEVLESLLQKAKQHEV